MKSASGGALLRIGVDSGGTFTDVVLESPDGHWVAKIPSIPGDPARAVLAGIDKILALFGNDEGSPEVVHGSTVATNALLERRGARTAFVTTKGLEGMLHIGRQSRPDLYSLEPRRSPPFVSEEDVYGVAGRLACNGAVLEEVDEEGLAQWALAIKETGVESAAVCFLHSYVDPCQEWRVAEALRCVGIPTTASADLVREYREYERALTAVANAYVAPLMHGYIERLGRRIPRLRVQASSSGTMPAELAAREPVRTLLSGPAGGVLGARAAAERAGARSFVSFDMGGTSTDVAVCGQSEPTVSGLRIAGMELSTPSLDIHTVGAGGGSIARVDAGGSLRVGPESAGADPGPACYGRGGDRATVTDANLVLGHLDPVSFLGGEMDLDVGAARAVLQRLGERLGCGMEEAARGVVAVAIARMARAIRQVTVARGLDPRDHDLVAFGGAGPMHGAALAEVLGIDRVWVPPDPGALSAVGMLRAPAVRENSRTVLLTASVDGLRQADRCARELGDGVAQQLRKEGTREIRIDYTADLRYQGQSHEIPVQWGEGPVEAFQAAYARRYGELAGRLPEVEVVTLRARAWSPAPVSVFPRGRGKARIAGSGRVTTFFSGEEAEAAQICDRSSLPKVLEGPALVVELSATTVVPPGWIAREGPSSVLELRREGRGC